MRSIFACETVEQSSIQYVHGLAKPGVMMSAVRHLYQVFGHISVTMLAAATGAELILPTAVTRSTFALDEYHTQWTPLPVDRILDVDHIKHFWRQRGILVHEVMATCATHTRLISGMLSTSLIAVLHSCLPGALSEPAHGTRSRAPVRACIADTGSAAAVRTLGAARLDLRF